MPYLIDQILILILLLGECRFDRGNVIYETGSLHNKPIQESSTSQRELRVSFREISLQRLLHDSLGFCLASRMKGRNHNDVSPSTSDLCKAQ